MTIDLNDFIFVRHLAEYKAAKMMLEGMRTDHPDYYGLTLVRDSHLAALKATGKVMA